MIIELPEPIKKFLEQRNFTILESLGNSRYIILKGVLPAFAQPVVIKAQQGAALGQRNHILWTRHMQNTTVADDAFHIAPILEYGSINDSWHWFIMPFIEGIPFASSSTDNDNTTVTQLKDFDKILPNIVALMRHIEKSEAKTVSGLDARHGSISKKDKLKLLEHAIDWARNDTPYVAELLQILNKNYKYLGAGNSHGDFTETNIVINSQNEPVLIDAEISNAYHYKYYDVAEFYNRLFTRLCRPDLAASFLKTYVASLPKSKQQRFFNNFLCLSALRCLGNFTEIEKFKPGVKMQKRLLYAKRYAQSIVSYDIVTLVDK